MRSQADKDCLNLKPITRFVMHREVKLIKPVFMGIVFMMTIVLFFKYYF